MYTYTAETLGTRLSIQISHSSSFEGEFLRIRELCYDFERRYSRFIERNPLHTLNSQGGGMIDPDLEAMLTFALSLAKQSNGHFDPTIAPLLDAYGYGIHAAAWPIGAIATGYQHVRIDDHRLTLDHGVQIEIGGVGKGYLLEKIARLCTPYDRVLIDFGGDIYARGGWDIALEHPLDPSLAIGTIRMEDGYFCASSGLRRQYTIQTPGSEPMVFHHLIDGHTRTPASDVIGSYVESDHGMVADGYATLLCVCPLAQSIDILRSGEIEGAIVSSAWELYRSESTRIEFFG